MRPHFCLFFVILACLCALTPLAAQSGRPPLGSSGSGRGSGSGSNQRETQADTFGLFAFKVDNPNEEEAFADSNLVHFQQYDPTRQRTFDYRNLGIMGSAHQPIVYEPWLRKGFAVGFRQFELYRIDGHNLPFYRLQRPYTNLSYVQGSEQADGYLTAQFSRNFADGLNFVVDYKRINQIGETDQYPNQQNRTTAIATGLWRRSKNGRYNGFLSFASNTTEHKDNGGLRIAPIDTTEFDTPSSAVVFLADARTRYASRELMYTQYYQMGGSTDSLGRSRRAFTLSHQFTYSKATYKFHDPYALSDSFFYQRWYPLLLPDGRGARYFVDHRLLENAFRISTFRLAGSRTRTQRDVLEVGLIHRFNRVDQEPADTVVNNLLLVGKIGLKPSPRIQLQLEGQLDLWDQAGDYRLTGEFFMDLQKAGALRLRANSQLYQATLVQQRHLITQTTLWQNTSFSRTLETNLSGVYALPALKLEAGAAYHLFNNYIYFDSTGLPAQLGSPISLFQLSLQKTFQLGRFFLSNTLAWQASQSDVLRVPSLFAKHSLYYTGRWFKRLDVQLGLDLRYITAYRADHYNPLTGQFNLQDRQEVPFIPNADLFFSMKLLSFRAFVKLENATTLLRPNDLLYLTAFYPAPDNALRIGIKWRMLD